MERVSTFAYHLFVVNCIGLTNLKRELARRKLRSEVREFEDTYGGRR